MCICAFGIHRRTRYALPARLLQIIILSFYLVRSLFFGIIINWYMKRKLKGKYIFGACDKGSYLLHHLSYIHIYTIFNFVFRHQMLDVFSSLLGGCCFCYFSFIFFGTLSWCTCSNLRFNFQCAAGAIYRCVQNAENFDNLYKFFSVKLCLLQQLIHQIMFVLLFCTRYLLQYIQTTAVAAKIPPVIVVPFKFIYFACLFVSRTCSIFQHRATKPVKYEKIEWKHYPVWFIRESHPTSV